VGIAAAGRMTDRIEVWPVMGRLAIALRETVVFRFWCILLHLARIQSGGKPINNVIVHLDDLLICDVEHPRTMRRYLDRAMALGYVRGFIPLGDDRWQVWFTGQALLAASLESRASSKGIMNSDEWDRRKLFITPSDFAQITKFSGAIFASWLAVAIDHERRITWEYLSLMWGVSRQAVEAWIVADGSIYRIENWGITHHPYIADFDDPHILLNESTGEYHFQRANTYGVENASDRFAAQGKVWAINGLAGQPSLSTGERGSASQRGSNAVTRHSARPIQNDPYAPTPSELRTNYRKPSAFSKQRNRKPSEALYLLRYVSVGFRRSGRARRVWHHSAPLFTS
jgi:hypothetical protein